MIELTVTIGNNVYVLDFIQMCLGALITFLIVVIFARLRKGNNG